MNTWTWKERLEVAGIVAVIISLVLLIIEVRENTAAVRRQTAIDSANALATPFFESDLPSVLAKIQEVDGSYRPISTYMEVYGLSADEAILWSRHLTLLWETLEAQYLADGSSEDLDNIVSSLLANRDNQLYLEGLANFRPTEKFREYLADRQANLDVWRETRFETSE